MYSSIFIFISHGFTDRKKKIHYHVNMRLAQGDALISGEVFYNK